MISDVILCHLYLPTFPYSSYATLMMNSSTWSTWSTCTSTFWVCCSQCPLGFYTSTMAFSTCQTTGWSNMTICFSLTKLTNMKWIRKTKHLMIRWADLSPPTRWLWVCCPSRLCIGSLRDKFTHIQTPWWWAWLPGQTGGTPGTWSQHSPRLCSTAKY